MALSNFGFTNGRRWRRRRGLAGSASEGAADGADLPDLEQPEGDNCHGDSDADYESESELPDAERLAGSDESTNQNSSEMPELHEAQADIADGIRSQMQVDSEWCYDQEEWQNYLTQESQADATDYHLPEELDLKKTSLTKNSDIPADQQTVAQQPDRKSSDTARSRFFTDEDHIIEGQPAVAGARVYPSMPEGLLDSAASETEGQDSPFEPSSMPRAGETADMQKENSDTEELTSGALMKDTANSNGSHQELAAPSRMERLHPKSANSLTGAPPPKVDGRVEDSVLSPESEVLLVVLHAPERNTFRTYLRRHDIPCRAAVSAENAVAIVLEMKPAMILISGSGMNPEEILTLVDDLNDMVDAPILSLLTESQIKLLHNDPLNSHVLQYPASLRHIRSELTRILLAEGNAKPRCSLRSALMPE